VLRHYGQLEGDIEKLRPAGAEPKLVKADKLEDYVPCPRTGVWEPVRDPGDRVRAGDLIGRIHDFADHASPPVEIRTGRDGYILMMHLSARPVKGQTLYVIAEEVPWHEVIG